MDWDDDYKKGQNAKGSILFRTTTKKFVKTSKYNETYWYLYLLKQIGPKQYWIRKSSETSINFLVVLINLVQFEICSNLDMFIICYGSTLFVLWFLLPEKLTPWSNVNLCFRLFCIFVITVYCCHCYCCVLLLRDPNGSFFCGKVCNSTFC